MWAISRAGHWGRRPCEGAERVKLLGEEIEVKAEICRLPGVGGHADREGLLRWDSERLRKSRSRYLSCMARILCAICLLERPQTEFGFSAYAPYSGAVYDLANGVFLEKPDGVRIRKDKRVAAAGKSSRMFEKLVAAGQRLIGVIRKNEGGANAGPGALCTGRGSLNCVTAGSDKSGHPAWRKGHRGA